MAFTTYDNAPYLYRKSGGGGDKEIDKLVGGTIAWNQLADIDNTTGSHYAETWASTISKQGNALKVTTTRDSDLMGFNFVTGVQHGKNHKILVTFKCSEETFQINNVSCALSNGWVNIGILTIGGNVFSGVINALDNGTQGNLQRVLFRVGGQSVTGDSVVVSNIKICDLTLMFGSTIADYVYSLEQSSQGSGLAWLRSYGFFTEDYYDYNSGELKSVSNLVSHDMTGKNLCPKFTGGTGSGLTYTVNEDGSVHVTGTNTGTAFWAVQLTLPKGTYVLSGAPTNGQLTLRSARGGGAPSSAFSGTLDDYGNGATFTVSETASAWLNIKSTAGTHDKTYYPMIRLASVTDDTYEPYTLYSYPLGDVTLRGLPKLNGNALYYDGDTYESNGAVTRRYIVLTVNGSESWGKEPDGWMSAQGVNSFYLSLQSAIQSNYIDGTIAVNATSNRLLVATYRDYRSGIAQPNWFTFTDGGVYIDISSTLSTVDELKAWLQSNPVAVVYELKTPTTETAEAYTNPRWVDPNGTERYTLSSNAFPMPVGHETTYNTDIGSKTVNTQVNLSMTEPSVRQIYAKGGDTARVLNIHLDQTEEDGTLRILRPDGTEVTADAVLVPEFYDGLMAEIPSDATSVVGKCYCDVEQNGVSSMPFTLNVKKNERQ